MLNCNGDLGRCYPIHWHPLGPTVLRYLHSGDSNSGFAGLHQSTRAPSTPSKQRLVGLQLPRQLQNFFRTPKRSKVMERRTLLIEGNLAAPLRVCQSLPCPGHVSLPQPVSTIDNDRSEMRIIEHFAAKIRNDSLHALSNVRKFLPKNSDPIKLFK